MTKAEGKNLIQVRSKLPSVSLPPTDAADPFLQACLNAPEPATGNENGVEPESTVESPEESAHAQLPPQHGMGRGPPLQPSYLTAEQQQQAIAYQNFMAQQQQAARGSYSIPPQAPMATHQPQA